MEGMSTGPRPRKTKNIVIVKTGEPVPAVAEARGQFADLIAEAIGPAWAGGYEVVDVRTDDPPSPASAAAFVITGSASNVPEREPWMIRVEAWLRDAVGSAPIFGICFGHQILAQALGGEVRRNPRGREIGTLRIAKIADDPILEGVPDAFEANVTHVDTVVRLPPGAEVLARSSLEDHHAVRFARACYGVQFHPEIDGFVMREYVRARREILDGEGFAVDRMLAEIGEGEPGRRTLRNFVRLFV
jgi:GMP synthase (glutamine-hydrolysing)